MGGLFRQKQVSFFFSVSARCSAGLDEPSRQALFLFFSSRLQQQLSREGGTKTVASASVVAIGGPPPPLRKINADLCIFQRRRSRRAKSVLDPPRVCSFVCCAHKLIIQDVDSPSARFVKRQAKTDVAAIANGRLCRYWRKILPLTALHLPKRSNAILHKKSGGGKAETEQKRSARGTAATRTQLHRCNCIRTLSTHTHHVPGERGKNKYFCACEFASLDHRCSNS